MKQVEEVIDSNMKQVEEVLLESFANPVHKWSAMNDPVMGGKSYSSVSIDKNLGIFDGEVVDVPFLHAPGFITMRGNGNYPDVSSCESLQITARASEQYSGYRVSFGNRHVPGNRFARGYKADFSAPVLEEPEMGTIVVPFKNFTVRWDDATGNAVVTCEENEDFCPDVDTLRNMKTISIWGEGVAGKVHLEIETVKAIGCSGTNGMTREAKGKYSQYTAQSSSKFLTVSVIVGILAVGFFSVFMARKRKRSYFDLNNIASSGQTSIV